jgi:hypothetical protein
MEEEQNGAGLLVELSASRQTKASYPTENLNHHEAEDGNISLTEEARGDTARMGVADDR